MIRSPSISDTGPELDRGNTPLNVTQLSGTASVHGNFFLRFFYLFHLAAERVCCESGILAEIAASCQILSLAALVWMGFWRVDFKGLPNTVRHE
jgi:hypothetical protein